MTNENLSGISVIIPVFNEKLALQKTMDRLRIVKKSLTPTPMQIVFVNDGSTDGSQEILQSSQNSDFCIRHHTKNLGYGASLKTGIQAAEHDCVAIMDADGTYPLEKLPEFFRQYVHENLDMLVGARTNKNVKIPLIRRPAKWFLNKLANVLINEKIPDLNSGFRLMRRTCVKSFFYLLPDGFSFTSTITLAMMHCNFKVKFAPIDYDVRSGKSKIRPIYDTFNFFQLVVRTAVYFNPVRFFFPITITIFLVSMGSLIYDIYKSDITDATVLLVVASIMFFAFTLISDQLSCLRKEIIFRDTPFRHRDGA